MPFFIWDCAASSACRSKLISRGTCCSNFHPIVHHRDWGECGLRALAMQQQLIVSHRHSCIAGPCRAEPLVRTDARHLTYKNTDASQILAGAGALDCVSTHQLTLTFYCHSISCRGAGKNVDTTRPGAGTSPHAVCHAHGRKLRQRWDSSSSCHESGKARSEW